MNDKAKMKKDSKRMSSKKFVIGSWKELQISDQKARFAVTSARGHIGILDARLGVAFGTDPDWCTVTVIDSDQSSCVRLNAAGIEIPDDLRKVLVRAGVRTSMDRVLGNLNAQALPLALLDLIREVRFGCAAENPRSLSGLILAVDAFPWRDPSYNSDSTNLRVLLREMRKIGMYEGKHMRGAP